MLEMRKRGEEDDYGGRAGESAEEVRVVRIEVVWEERACGDVVRPGDTFARRVPDDCVAVFGDVDAEVSGRKLKCLERT